VVDVPMRKKVDGDQQDLRSHLMKWRERDDGTCALSYYSTEIMIMTLFIQER